MSRVLEVITPEQVAIRYELAGFGSRAVAAAIDGAFQLLGYLALLVIGWLIFVGARTVPTWDKMGESVSIAILVLVFFAVLWGYSIAFETLWNGETPGKRWLGLRVIKTGGYPVDFRAVVIRNLIRAVDVLPMPTYALALVTVLFTSHYQRLGDLAAGTLVVRHGQDHDDLHAPSLGEVSTFRLLDTTVTAQLARLSRDQYRMVQRFLGGRDDLPPVMRAEFAQRLAAPLIAVFGYQPPALGMDYERWLEELDLAYRQRTLGVPVAGVTLSPPSPPATPAEAPHADTRRW